MVVWIACQAFPANAVSRCDAAIPIEETGHTCLFFAIWGWVAAIPMAGTGYTLTIRTYRRGICTLGIITTLYTLV